MVLFFEIVNNFAWAYVPRICKTLFKIFSELRIEEISYLNCIIFGKAQFVPIHLTSDLMQLFIATFGSAADIAIVYFQQGSTKWMGEKGRFVIYRIENL